MENKTKSDYAIDSDLEGKLTIRKTNNGFCVIYYEELTTKENEPVTYRRRYVSFDEDIHRHDIDENIENKLDDKEKSMYKLLLFIKDYFGVMYNKHKQVNLVIDFENVAQEKFEKGLEVQELSEKKKQLLKLVDDFYNSVRESCEDLDNAILEGEFTIIDNPYNKLRKFIEEL